MEHKKCCCFFFCFIYIYIYTHFACLQMVFNYFWSFSVFLLLLFHVVSIWHLLVYLRGGGLLSFHANFYNRGVGGQMSGGAYVLHSHSRGVDRGVLSPFSLSPFSHPSSPFSHPLFSFSLLCLGLRFGLSRSEVRNWSLPKSAKISFGWKVKRQAMIRNWYNQIPHPALKAKREITKYHKLTAVYKRLSR